MTSKNYDSISNGLTGQLRTTNMLVESMEIYLNVYASSPSENPDECAEQHQPALTGKNTVFCLL